MAALVRGVHGPLEDVALNGPVPAYLPKGIITQSPRRLIHLIGQPEYMLYSEPMFVLDEYAFA